jgi:hypothetical protein
LRKIKEKMKKIVANVHLSAHDGPRSEWMPKKGLSKLGHRPGDPDFVQVSIGNR